MNRCVDRVLFSIVFMMMATSAFADTAARSVSGLQALYDFRMEEAGRVLDRSNVGEPLHLTIEDTDAVRWSDDGLEIVDGTRIRSEGAASKIINAVRWSGELTLEAWIRPANTGQQGPARIVTLSQNGSQRNVTLGQDGDKYDIRLRTTTTSSNGLPSLNSGDGSLTTEKTHVVYTRSRTGKTKIYINGEIVQEKVIDGGFSTWSESHRLGLANEMSGDRAWRGTYSLVAIYNRSLQPDEVRQHYALGTDDGALIASSQHDENHELFTRHVAPILVRHCFECHDPATKDGGLDVSSEETLLAGGNSGVMLIPGKPDESILMSMVNADVMPLARASLSEEEKALLEQWIAQGAEWPVEQIDAAVYAHGESDEGVWVQRLTRREYIDTVMSTLGIDIETEALELLPPDVRTDGFSNTAYNLTVDLKHVQAYSALAKIIVEKKDGVAWFARRFGNTVNLSDDNMRPLIARMGKWVLRGPLTDDEINIYRGISTTVVSAGGEFEEAMASILKAMLQSPRFVYRIENQRGDGSMWPTNEYELASRLSYMLWGASPDEALMNAADDGTLMTTEGIQSQIARMLNDPRAVDRSAQFFGEWLNLGALQNLRPSEQKFPEWNPQLAEDMKQESLAFFRYVAWELDQPLTKLFNAQVTFLTQRLAEHYGIEPVSSEDDEGALVRYDLASVPSRGGLLTHGSVLTKGGDEASMVTRGLFVLHDVLRGTVQDPPPGVDTSPVASEPGVSQRRISERRIADSSCGGCHQKFEPLAFGLEKFDGIGAFHESDEHGNTLREDGAILFPGEGEPIEYETTTELMDHLSKSDRVNETITWKVAQYALGRPLGPHDVSVLNTIHAESQANGGTYKDVVTALALSDLIRMTPTEAYP